MARPRVFVSSTYYDLKHIRSSLDAFIESLGFEAILSEKGDIAYSPDAPLDESCYREAANADLFVLIIGGRYGSEASSEQRLNPDNFRERYDSITKKEFRAALGEDVPIYILVDSSVYGEYRTFQKNRKNDKITYAHVDSVNIFHLLDEILGLRRNNPVQSFEKASDIQNWLREQWGGLFKEFLAKRSQQQQLATLAGRVEELGEVNRTLRRYTEAIITKLSPDESDSIIGEEQKRLESARSEMELRRNGLFCHLEDNYNLSYDSLVGAAKKAKSLRGFCSILKKSIDNEDTRRQIDEFFKDYADPVLQDLNEARRFLNLSTV
jgi:hypothetical protein